MYHESTKVKHPQCMCGLASEQIARDNSEVQLCIVAVQPNILSMHDNSHAQQKVAITAGNLNLLISS